MIALHLNKVSNEKIELYQEDGRYFFKVDFDYEDDYAYYKGEIGRIPFYFQWRSIKRDTTEYLNPKVTVDLGLKQDMEVHRDENGHYYTLTVIKEKIHEMTVEEIEKKLGYKVKIVSNGD